MNRTGDTFMRTTLVPPYAVHTSAGGLLREYLVSLHFDPAEAIQACEDLMFIKAADGHALKLLDAEKTHQIKLLADQAEVTKKQRRAETDKNRKRELKVDLAKATRRIGVLRMLIVRVDTTDAEQAPVTAAAGVDITDAEQALPSRYKVYRRCANDYVDEVPVSEHFDPAEAISACGKEMFITAADGHSRKLLDAEKILQIRLLADQAEMIHEDRKSTRL